MEVWIIEMSVNEKFKATKFNSASFFPSSAAVQHGFEIPLSLGCAVLFLSLLNISKTKSGFVSTQTLKIIIFPSVKSVEELLKPL